jgi:hypothetical protein
MKIRELRVVSESGGGSRGRVDVLVDQSGISVRYY